MVEILDELLLNMEVSDIHIEQKKDFGLIKARIRTELLEYKKISRDECLGLIQKIKAESRMELDKSRMCQDGSFTTKKGEKLFIRVSSLPTIFGEKLSLRVLREKCSYGIDSLRYLRRGLFDTLKLAKSGLILVGGPTGSGKTTTVYNMIQLFKDAGKNIISIEDPVEYLIPFINQVEVNDKANLSFNNLLRSILRQDPDIIVVGELRDAETVELALSAAITGHLVIATIHCKDSYGAVERMADMGASINKIKEVLIGVLYQRLVRENCICNVITKPKCKACNSTGYLGKIVAGEYFINDRFDNMPLSREAAGVDMVSLRDYCKFLYMSHVISKEEYISISI